MRKTVVWAILALTLISVFFMTACSSGSPQTPYQKLVADGYLPRLGQSAGVYDYGFKNRSTYGPLEWVGDMNKSYTYANCNSALQGVSPAAVATGVNVYCSGDLLVMDAANLKQFDRFLAVAKAMP